MKEIPENVNKNEVIMDDNNFDFMDEDLQASRIILDNMRAIYRESKSEGGARMKIKESGLLNELKVILGSYSERLNTWTEILNKTE